MKKSPPMQKTNSTQIALPFWRQLGTKLIWAFVLLGTLPVLIVTVAILNRTGSQATDQVYNQLDSVAELKSDQILRWLDEGDLTMSTLLSDPNLERFTNLAASQISNPQERTRVSEILIGAVESQYFKRMFIYDENGVIVASSNFADIKKNVKDQPYFNISLHADYIQSPIFDPATKQLAMYITRPLRSGKIQASGVLVGELNIDTLANIMTKRTGLGESGETYLVSLQNNNLLTPSRFEGYGMGVAYHSEGIDQALEGKKGRGAYVGYRPVTVFGSYVFIPELQAALLAEVEQSQALAAYRQAQWVGILIALISNLAALVVGLFTSRSISRPIRALTVSAQRIGAGNLKEEVVELRRQDEIGVLARAFQQMQHELASLYQSLEQRVADRTKALATTSEVSRRLSTILDQKELVIEVVNEVKDAFGYYHAQIYFYDEANENLVMAGGTGVAGEKMLAQFHKVAKGRGLVGRAAESNRAVLVSDTSQNPEWLPNPLLPDTESEVAVPISIGDKVLGVLDVQHNITDGLQQEDVASLQSIANQVANALQNIRQYESTQKVANDLSVVANVSIATATITDINLLLQEVADISKKSFNLYHAHIYMLNENGDTLELAAGAGEVGRQMVAEGRQIPLDSEKSLVARAARTREGVVVNNVAADPDFLPNPLLPATRAEMAVPMVIAGKVLGVLDVQSEQIDRFTEIDVNIKTTLASQVAIAVQNARSFLRSRDDAERETKLNLITQKIQSATTIEAALQTTVRELGRALGKNTSVALDSSALTDKHNV
jgi:GAF domain-containing protein